MNQYKSLYQEMSNIYPFNSGVPYVLWISQKSGREKHGARIKVSVPQENKFLTFTVSTEPKLLSKTKISLNDINSIKSWIILNQTVLIKFFNGEFDTVQFWKKLKKLQ